MIVVDSVDIATVSDDVTILSLVKSSSSKMAWGYSRLYSIFKT